MVGSPGVLHRQMDAALLKNTNQKKISPTIIEMFHFLKVNISSDGWIVKNVQNQKKQVSCRVKILTIQRFTIFPKAKR